MNRSATIRGMIRRDTVINTAAERGERQRANRNHKCRRWARATPLLRGLAMALLLAGPLSLRTAAQPAAKSPDPAPQMARDQWKDCAYNTKVIRCQDQQQGDSLQILWVDGIRSSFVRKPARGNLPSYWGDRYGGLWRRELLPQGNTLLTNLATGNRILVPLRYPCKPPLKGEVGYCHY